MKKFKIKLIGLIILFLIAAFTPSCEAFWQAMQEANEQVEDEDNNKNNTDQDKTSKGKGQG